MSAYSIIGIMACLYRSTLVFDQCSFFNFDDLKILCANRLMMFLKGVCKVRRSSNRTPKYV